MQTRKTVYTKDGSTTLALPEWNEHYHSTHGAIQEALHVFIKNGISIWQDRNSEKDAQILEFGLGTGLNAWLACWYAITYNSKINYDSIEKYPINPDEIETLNYHSSTSVDFPEPYDKLKVFNKIHQVNWEENQEIMPNFALRKIQADFKTVALEKEKYDIVFFDAFGKRVQPELWTVPIFQRLYNSLKQKGLFTTYACNGSSKRALREVGFSLEIVAGPPGKREMINAWKN